MDSGWVTLCYIIVNVIYLPSRADNNQTFNKCMFIHYGRYMLQLRWSGELYLIIETGGA